ncbi:MAG: hypothetical protein ACK2UI_07705 [Anaerolineae bacterium]
MQADLQRSLIWEIRSISSILKGGVMVEEKQKKLRLVTYWLFSSVMIVFAAVFAALTAYLFIFAGDIWMAVKGALPITLIVAVSAAIIYAVYYFLIYKKD